MSSFPTPNFLMPEKISLQPSNHLASRDLPNCQVSRRPIFSQGIKIPRQFSNDVGFQDWGELSSIPTPVFKASLDISPTPFTSMAVPWISTFPLTYTIRLFAFPSCTNTRWYQIFGLTALPVILAAPATHWLLGAIHSDLYFANSVLILSFNFSPGG